MEDRETISTKVQLTQDQKEILLDTTNETNIENAIQKGIDILISSVKEFQNVGMNFKDYLNK